MKKKFSIALSMLVCMSALFVGLTACGSDEPAEPTTGEQEFIVKGEFIRQSGNYIDGEAGLNDANTSEFRFYKAIYEEVANIIKPQVWTISYKTNEKTQKISEQNVIASDRFSAMIKALDAVQKQLDQTDKNTYKCHFSMTIKMTAVGESEIRSGEKTLKYEGNE